ncbi:MAG: hypothetical protein IKR14_02770 [Lachnospiraceae bacterium]|nr:hypothetical protein [Lachnospiraceae bacterium]
METKELANEIVQQREDLYTTCIGVISVLFTIMDELVGVPAIGCLILVVVLAFLMHSIIGTVAFDGIAKQQFVKNYCRFSNMMSSIYFILYLIVTIYFKKREGIIALAVAYGVVLVIAIVNSVPRNNKEDN